MYQYLEKRQEEIDEILTTNFAKDEKVMVVEVLIELWSQQSMKQSFFIDRDRKILCMATQKYGVTVMVISPIQSVSVLNPRG